MLQVMAAQTAQTAPSCCEEGTCEKEKSRPEMIQSSCGRYCWRDEAMVCVVEISCPAETKAKDVSCTIGKNNISCSVATLSAENREVLQGELFQAVDQEESMWSLEDTHSEHSGRLLCIELQKAQEMRWLQVTR